LIKEKHTNKRLFLQELITLAWLAVSWEVKILVNEYSSKEELWRELHRLQQVNKELEASNTYYRSVVQKLGHNNLKYIFNINEQPYSGQSNADNDKSLVSFEQAPQPTFDNSKKYHISELIDIDLLQQLFDSFYELTGIMHAFLDVDTNILSRIGWTDMCLNFHRSCTETEHRCIKSDSFMSAHLQDGPYIRYRCLNGLIDYATPIIVEGQHLATIYMGQLLNEPPDEEYFRRQAQEFGYDEEAYIEALHKINIVPEHRIKPIMEFYSKLGQVLASIGLERKRKLEAADLAIRESEERLRLVLEASNDGFWDWNIQTDRFYYSQRWAEILGYSMEELEPTFHTWRQRIHPDDNAATMNSLLEHLRGKTPKFQAEYRLLTKSGEGKWILDRGKVVARSEDGKPLRVVGTCIDITDRKQAETTLRISEDKFSKAFNCSPAPITITTLKEGSYIEVNDAWVKETGYKRDQAIGMTGIELGIWDNEDARKLFIKQISVHGSAVNYKTTFRMKSGAIRNYLISAEIVDMNQQSYVICVHINITERIKAEEALRQSEEKFSKVFHGSPIMMTLSSLEEGRLIHANEALFAGMGYTCDEILGKSITDEINFFVDTEKRQKYEKILLEKGKLENVEIDFRTKSGEIRNGLIWSHLLNLNEKQCRITSLIDITEQKRIEQEMARLSDLNLIGEMAASIGHEIRNPMTSVRGFLQMFKNKYVEDVEFLDLMIEELDRANEIISEFLGMAKNKIVYLQPQYIDQIVKTIYPMLEADANYKGMKIELDLQKPPMPVIDQNEIRQVIFNLARNGLEAMSSGGTLTIGTMVEEDEIVLYVKDEGHGLKPEVMDKIGIPFFTTKEKGTGLGLAVCYSIAARHNAKLEVKTSSEGTTFKMKFPKHKEVEMA